MAKQAALVDLLSGGRFRLGIGVGWNEVEFIGLNKNFRNRGKRSAEQVQVMQALWAEPHVRFAGEFHHIDDAGINPRPTSGRVPIWYGGHAERPSGAVQNTATATCRSPIPRRGPSGMGSRFGSPRAPAHQRIGGAKPSFGKRTEVTHVTAHTTYISGHHKRIPGRNVADHWTLITHYREAVADLL